MRSKALLGLIVVASLSVFADRPHDLFNAHREKVLSEGVVTVDDYVFLVGRANSPHNRGDAVGWTKAAESAKWKLGDRFKSSAAWASDITEDEKRVGWIEYRAMHPNRFNIVGMQRVWTQKTPPDRYLVVMAVPSASVDLSPPTEDDLRKAVAVVRERRRLQRESELRKAEQAKAEADAAKKRAGYREESSGAVRQQQADEDLIL